MKKILVVDDEPSIVRLLSFRLRANNYDVLGAENGLACIEMAKNYNPDLILMDIKMPQCDGIEAFAKLKKSQCTRNIPVLFMTAFPKNDVINKINKMGAKGCISKPFIHRDFEESVRKALA